MTSIASSSLNIQSCALSALVPSRWFGELTMKHLVLSLALCESMAFCFGVIGSLVCESLTLYLSINSCLNPQRDASAL